MGGNKYLTSCLVLLVVMNLAHGPIAEPQVPCYFIFGDSLVDNGNNNYISSLAVSDYLPYGIDFPGGPTGRFSNGKTPVDVIAEKLGFEDNILPYATARGQDILRGVNFASAAGGIRSESGRNLGGRIDFAGQVNNYRNTASEIAYLLGDDKNTSDYLSKCIHTVGIGSNDYLNNYFMPAFYSTGSRYTPEEYADSLIRDYSEQIKQMYNYGARKIALIGLGQAGCNPNVLARLSLDGLTCVEPINLATQQFNARLKGLVDNFTDNLPGANLTYIDSHGIFQDLLDNASAYGFKVKNEGCCGIGRNNGLVTCLPMEAPCRNRSEYLFWDAFHPSEAANIITGGRAYRAEKESDAYPIDIRGLALL